MNLRSPLAVVALAAAMLLGACASLPSGAPTSGEVTGGLAPGEVDVIDITPATPSGETVTGRQFAAWSIPDAPPRLIGAAPGDVLQISVYEIGYSLFASSRVAAPRGIESVNSANSATHTLPPVTVPEDGRIRVPFAGTIQVAMMSARQIAEAIEARLKGQSQNAQVLVTIEDGPLRSVVLSGDVKQPGRVRLTQANERLLDAIALAAGPDARSADTLVRLTRGTTTDTARLDAIAATSPENVVLGAGDRIELVRDVRTLTILGSAKAVSEITFDSLELTLSEALARAGGLIDEKADPTGVFIFRQEPRAGGGVRPVIYRLNLLEPAGYFAAQNFLMRENDIVLIANARTVRLEAFLRMVNSLTAPVVSVDVLTR